MPDITSISWWREKTAKFSRFLGWGFILIIALPLVIGFGWNQYSGKGNQTDTGMTAVIAKINNEPITKMKLLRATNRDAGGGVQYALAQGQAIDILVQQAAIAQLAKQKGVKVADSDIDRRMSEEKKAVTNPTNGDKKTAAASDNAWEDYVLQSHGMSLNEYRDALSRDPSMLAQALVTKGKTEERVTQDELKALNDEVQIRTVLIPSGKSMFSDPKTITLSEPDAKKKTEELLAKINGGADFVKIAAENSKDIFNAKGTKTIWQKIESDGGPQSAGMAQFYGKEFKEALAKTEKGKLTEIVKASGFLKGFVFAKVEDKRNTPPKDYDPKKIEDSLKQRRATEKLGKEVETLITAAKVDFTKDGEDYKAYYDYYKLQVDQQKMQGALQAQMSGQEAPLNVPTKADIEAKQKVVDTEIEALYKRLNVKGKEDSASALLYSTIVKKKLAVASQADKPALTQTLIKLYETSLNTTEDRQMRFDLGDLYRTSNKNDLASAMYKKISHYLDIAPGFDTPSRKEEAESRKTLMTCFRSLGDEANAGKEQATAASLLAKIAEDEKLAEEKRKAAMPPAQIGTKSQSVNGGQKTGVGK